MRLAQIDYMKSICIILMVLIHYGYNNGTLTPLIVGFHMPVFIMVSGFLYRRRTLTTDMLSFGVPLLVFSLIQYSWHVAYNVFLTHSIGISELTLRSLSTLFTINDNTYFLFEGCWFVLGLLYIRLLLQFIDINRYGLPLALCCLLLTEANGLFGFSDIIKEWHLLKPVEMFPFFWLGYQLKKRNIDVGITRGMVCIALFIIITLFNGDVDMWNATLGHSCTLLIIANLFMFVGLYNLLSIRNNGIIKTLSVGTLAILGSHRIIYEVNSSLIRHSLSLVTNEQPDFLFHPLSMTILFIVEITPLLYLLEKRYPIILGKIKK